jgi:hypothetical protein
MTDGLVEVITSVERRRRWSQAEKRRLVAATLGRERAYRRSPGRPGSIRASCGAGGGRCGRPRRCTSRQCGLPMRRRRLPRMPAPGRSRSSFPGLGCGLLVRRMLRRC